MSTIVGIEIDDGALLAGDRVHVEGGTRVSENVRRVFDVEGAGAAAVGEPGAIEEFGRELDAETREYGIEHDETVGVDRFARTASRIAQDTGVTAIVSARDDDGLARIRSVDSDGSVLSDATAAFGSGAQQAIGQMDSADVGDDLGHVEDRVRDMFSAIAERDSETGDEVDVWTLESQAED